jgi:hypothetical protein
MANSGEQKYAVIMGDLVRSEHSDHPELLYARFNEAVAEQNEKHRKTIASPLTITLGDEFQGLVSTLTDAALIARDLRLNLMHYAIDCRFTVGIVSLMTPINRDRAWNMVGSGLARAREKLNEKKDISLYRFSIEKSKNKETVLEALGAGLTSIEQNWTKKQLENITKLIQGASPAQISQQQKITVHSVYKVRNSGRFEIYMTLWNAIIESLEEIESQWDTL